MKLIINENVNIDETEIILNCSSLDSRLRHLVDYLKQYSFSLEGMIDDTRYFVPTESIIYIDSVDKLTFFYDRHRVYQYKGSLNELTEKLENAMFVRISKSAIANLSHLRGIRPCGNHKHEALLSNGERILVGRAYAAGLKEKLACYNILSPVPSFSLAQNDNCLPCRQEVCERSVVNMGKILAFQVIPSRIVALSFSEAEILAALGLSDKLIAIAPAECTSDDVCIEYRDALSRVPLLKRQDIGVPAVSTLQSLSPDFVLGSVHSLNALDMDSSGKRRTHDFTLYIMTATNPPEATMESYYHDLMNLGRIFRIEDKALGLVEHARKKIAIARRILAKTKPVRVFVYDGGIEAASTTGKGSFENDLITLAGGQNIFAGLAEGYTKRNWAQVAEENPEYIIIHDYDDGLSAEEKISYLKSRNDLKDAVAVKENRFIVVSLHEVFPCIQSVATVEKLIRAFHPVI